jgi:hypothetical protein
MIAAAAVTSRDVVLALVIVAAAVVLGHRLNAAGEWVARILGRRPARRTIVARSHGQRRPRSTPPYDWARSKEERP